MSCVNKKGYPIYPAYCPISVLYKDTFIAGTSRFFPYSDFDLVSLLCWNSHSKNVFSTLNSNLVIGVKDYLGDALCFSIIGTHQLFNSVETFLKETKKLSFVPEEVATLVETKKNFLVMEDRDNFDYILDTKIFGALRGSVYKDFRKVLGAFDKKNKGWVLRTIDLCNKSFVKEVVDLVHVWCRDKSFTQAKTSEVIFSLDALVKIYLEFKIVCFGLYIKDRLVAFSANEIIGNGWAFGLFGFSLRKEFPDVARVLEYLVSIELLKLGVRYLNIQQDVGEVGLRTYKTSLKPARFLKKYTISNENN